MSFIVVKQKKSLISESAKQRAIMQSLGLGRIGSQNKLKDNNCIRGQVNKVKHLIDYQLTDK